MIAFVGHLAWHLGRLSFSIRSGHTEGQTRPSAFKLDRWFSFSVCARTITLPAKVTSMRCWLTSVRIRSKQLRWWRCQRSLTSRCHLRLRPLRDQLPSFSIVQKWRGWRPPLFCWAVYLGCCTCTVILGTSCSCTGESRATRRWHPGLLSACV